MLPNAFAISGFLSAVAHRGRAIIGISDDDRRKVTSGKVIELCHKLLSSNGEASGIALSFEILSCYQYLSEDEKLSFFQALNSEFSAPRTTAIEAAQNYLNDPSDENLSDLSEASEPRRRRLILRLNQASNATLMLIKMREDLLGCLKKDPNLIVVDADFKKLFTSWFNGGFLNLKRLDWSSSASILEKIIRYEAVHDIAGWDDLRKRLDPPDRYIYGFFHPRLEEEPLIFVEVALTVDKPSQISSILDTSREMLDPSLAKTAVFYSISNCQQGLRGVPLGSFLIKQVVEDLRATFTELKDYVTLSPVPSYSNWVDQLLNDGTVELSKGHREALSSLIDGQWVENSKLTSEMEPLVHSSIASYLVQQKNGGGLPKDPVARFHLGNGAQLERINWPADLSPVGLKASYGAMVNYSYKLADIEKNHERFVENGEIATSSNVDRLARIFDNSITLLESNTNDVA